MNLEEKQICREAVEVFGSEHQMVVAIEELSELQKELCKFLRGEGVTEHLYEELADAEIMIEQVKHMLAPECRPCRSVEDRLACWRERKLTRLAERIEARGMPRA